MLSVFQSQPAMGEPSSVFWGSAFPFCFGGAAVGEEIRVSEELRERDVLSSREESFSPASDTIAVSL